MKDIAKVFRREWYLMLHDRAVLIFFILLPLAYPIVYTLIYNPEVVRKLPVAVVDDCRTEASRELVRQASAAPQFALYAYAPNMTDAKAMMAEKKVFGVMHIPSDYDKCINRGEQANVMMYCDMSLLLRYRTLLTAMANLQIKLAGDITEERMDMIGASASGGLPVKTVAHFLGDTQQGFASFVIPGIVVLILQQSLLLGICILGASSRHRRRENGGVDPEDIQGASAFSTVWGKALAYVVFYIPVSIYILHFIPEMFKLPHYGSPVDYLLFIFPMLLAVAFFGQALVILVREREYVFLVIVFTSVVFLFLSGLTWPRYAMSDGWKFVGDIVPATHGVEGFIRINSNGATLAENSRPYLWLWALMLIYMLLSMWVTYYLRNAKSCLARSSR